MAVPRAWCSAVLPQAELFAELRRFSARGLRRTEAFLLRSSGYGSSWRRLMLTMFFDVTRISRDMKGVSI